MTLRVAAATLVLLSGAAATSVTAQSTRVDSAIVEALLDIRTVAGTGRAVSILRMSSGSFAVDARERLADSLVSLATVADTSHQAARIAFAALRALSASGRSEGPGVSFAGAGRALFEVARRDGSHMKGGAVSALSSLADSAERINRLMAIAELDARIAETAIIVMYSGLGAEGLAALRELHRRRSVKNGPARSQLQTYAEMYGWATNPPNSPVAGLVGARIAAPLQPPENRLSFCATTD